MPSLTRPVLINAQIVKAWPGSPLVWPLVLAALPLAFLRASLLSGNNKMFQTHLIFFLPQDTESAVLPRIFLVPVDGECCWRPQAG